MSTTATAIVTGIGLALALAGVGSGVVAYVQTLGAYDTRPAWVWGARVLGRLRLIIRRRPAQLRSLGGAAVVKTSGTGHLTVGISEDLPTEEQVKLLVGRVAELAQQAAADRARFAAEASRQDKRPDEAVRDLQGLARTVAVGSVRLQIWGLILVGAGTVLMAVPAIAALFG